jgi:hypothetical protein
MPDVGRRSCLCGVGMVARDCACVAIASGQNQTDSTRAPSPNRRRELTTAPRHSHRPVSQAPLLRDESVLYTEDRYLVHADALSRGSQVKERPLVYARRYVPRHGFVALNDDVLDSLSPVGEGSANAFDCKDSKLPTGLPCSISDAAARPASSFRPVSWSPPQS